MRILLAAQAFPPRSTAGVEVYTLRVAQALKARGHEVLVLAAAYELGAEPYATRRRVHEGVDVFEVVNLHQAGTLEATYEDGGVEAAVAPALRDFRPDCVHFQHLLNLSRGLVPAARAFGARTILTVHDYWLSCPRDGQRMREDLVLCETVDHDVCARCVASSPYLVRPLPSGLGVAARRAGIAPLLHRIHDAAPGLAKAALAVAQRIAPRPPAVVESGMDARATALRETLAQVDCVLAPTAFARDRTLAFGAAADRTRVLPLGVLRGAACPRRAATRRRVGFVGTLAPHKGVHVLIEAFRGLEAPDATLEIHGGTSVQPTYVAALRRAAGGDARIRFHGPFAEGTQDRVLAGIDVLAQPSIWWENSPLTVLEALGAGIPVVASRIGGIPELIPDGAGLLVPPRDPAALRAALAAIMDGALGEPRPPLPLKTVAEHAAELEAVYAGA